MGSAARSPTQQGDVLDRDSVDALVKGADVVMHLAFILIGDPEEAQRINLEGSRNVFEATVAAKAKRLVYTSSVAAYGFHEDNPQPLTEDVPTRGTDSFYYSAHKAELEEVLDEVLAGSEGRCLRVPAVHRRRRRGDHPDRDDGRDAAAVRAAEDGQARPRPGAVPRRRSFPIRASISSSSTPRTSPTALLAGAEGAGEPGRYNLAGQGAMSVTRMSRALGWWSVPVPGAAVAILDGVASKLPGLPAEAAWLTTFRLPVLMDTRKAKEELGWDPQWDAESTLRETISGARAAGAL